MAPTSAQLFNLKGSEILRTRHNGLICKIRHHYRVFSLKIVKIRLEYSDSMLLKLKY